MGFDPGLRFTGWGCLKYEKDGSFVYQGHGIIAVPSSLPIAERLHFLFKKLQDVLKTYSPDEVAIEEVFMNKNAGSTMKLCMARGIAMLVPATLGLSIYEYGANCIKKTVTGQGHANKTQVKAMVEFILPKFKENQSKSISQLDCSDALSVAICHAQHRLFLLVTKETEKIHNNF